jgi:hypothetical protein
MALTGPAAGPQRKFFSTSAEGTPCPLSLTIISNHVPAQRGYVIDFWGRGFDEHPSR